MDIATPQMLLASATATWAILGLSLRSRRSVEPMLSVALRVGAILATVDLVTNTHFGMPIGAMLVAIAVARALSQPQLAELPVTGTQADKPLQPVTDEVPQNQDLLTPEIMRDLRAPLTSVLAAVELSDEDDGRAAHAATLLQLRTYGRQLANAINDIEDLGGLLRGELDLAEDTFDLQQLVLYCIDEVAPTTAEREVSLRYDPSPTLPQMVQGDPSRIRQLIARLLQLASVRCTIGPVDISASADENHIHIVLLNLHAGLEDPDGLGVMFARELAQALGGDLKLRARDDGGSEFHVTIAKKLPEDWEIELLAQDQQSSSPPQAVDGHKVQGSVLLISDHHDHQNLLARLLSQTGAMVSIAHNREMALHMMASTSPDLLLLDMQSDNQRGFSTITAIRELDVGIPILALTSDCSTPFIESCLSAGCNGHLAKPIEHAQLHGAIAMHLAAAD
jgi:CheY-like chemotaxis protein/signal transduction histidine kinase